MRSIVIGGTSVVLVVTCIVAIWIGHASHGPQRRAEWARMGRLDDATRPRLPGRQRGGAGKRTCPAPRRYAAGRHGYRDTSGGRSRDRACAAAGPSDRNHATIRVCRRPRPATEVPTAEPEIPEPVAREALSFVGADPLAEAAWVTAINDPSIGPGQRKDLIEDLNQDGFADPKHLTSDDMPLILSRLALIEELAPESMDDVNAAAFAEAYKDLVNMLLKVSQQ